MLYFLTFNTEIVLQVLHLLSGHHQTVISDISVTTDTFRDK